MKKFTLQGRVQLVVAVVTIPFIIQGLGIDRFGLLSLAWVVLGYFAIFDLGLGRATTKFVAEAFYFLSIPVVLVSSSFRGVLEAAQTTFFFRFPLRLVFMLKLT